MAAATKICESAPVGALYLPRSLYLMNGYINHGYKSKNIKAAPPKKPGTIEGPPSSSATNGSAAGEVGSADVPAGVSANGVAEVNAVTLSCNLDQTAQDPTLSAPRKNRRRKKKYRHKKKR